jgi:phosphoribosylformylglycinamidine cyclo-ligase
MENSRSAAYAAAGVDITAGYKGVKLMSADVKRTHIPGVVSDIGGFGGLFAPDVSGMSEPVLVSGTDGVGTKLRLAELMGKHDTIGIDCVAMCVNDVICCGAKPLFFLDYIAIGKNVPEKVASIVSGVAEGCVQAGCALIGGETAEHPGMMAADDYDLAGFTVGLVDKPKVIDSGRMAAGDVVLALPSSGFHSNGYSLVRKVFDVENTDLNRYYDELGETLGEALLRPTVIYVKPVLRCIDAADVRGVSHITGGGFYENIPRCIPDGLCARIDKAAIRTPAVFGLLQAKGGIDEHDMFNTFNMGVGMVVVVSPETAEARSGPRASTPTSAARSSPAKKKSVYAETACRQRRRPDYEQSEDRRAGLRRRHKSAGAARRTGSGHACPR